MKKFQNCQIFLNKRSADVDKNILKDDNWAYIIVHNRKTSHFKLPFKLNMLQDRYLKMAQYHAEKCLIIVVFR